jgi:1-aminocyclopropane-1-carboxylate synthase
LKECYDGLKDAMDAIDVPVTPCQGTMMAWVDFRKYLKEPKDAQAEADLWEDLCDNSKIIFTTGESCKTAEPGFFRVCFAYPDIGDSKDMQVAMKELKKRLIKKFKTEPQDTKEDYYDLTFESNNT